MPPVQQQNTASTATKTRIDPRIEGAPSLRSASCVAIGTSVRIDLQRHRHVCLASDPHDHPRVDFQVHQQRCASPPRVVNGHLADTGLVTSSGRRRLRARGSRASHTCRRTPGVDPRRPRQTSPASALCLSPCQQRSDCWAVLGSSARRRQRRWRWRSPCWARNASARQRVEPYATDP